MVLRNTAQKDPKRSRKKKKEKGQRLDAERKDALRMFIVHSAYWKRDGKKRNPDHQLHLPCKSSGPRPLMKLASLWNGNPEENANFVKKDAKKTRSSLHQRRHMGQTFLKCSLAYCSQACQVVSANISY
jgi:hypothetical protein